MIEDIGNNFAQIKNCPDVSRQKNNDENVIYNSKENIQNKENQI